MNELIYTLLPALTGIITFLLTRRKYSEEVAKAKAEARGQEIDNTQKAIAIWRQLTEDLKARLEADIAALRAENTSMKEQLGKVLHENNSMNAQMASLEKELRETKLENKKLTEQLKQFNRNYNASN